MPDFDYNESRNDAFALISEFGADALALEIVSEYDPVSGENTNPVFTVTNLKAVCLPIKNVFGTGGEEEFGDDVIAGRIKGFYVSALDRNFNPEPGVLIVWQEKIWDIVGVTEFAPAGVLVFFTLACKESAKYDWPALKITLGIPENAP